MCTHPSGLYGPAQKDPGGRIRHVCRAGIVVRQFGRVVLCKIFYEFIKFLVYTKIIFIGQQVTYSFCKEFISLLLHHAQAGGGDTKTTHILTKLFQKVCTNFK